MTRIYLSGPMTGVPDHGVPAFAAAAEKLRAVGCTVENPGEWGVGEMSWEGYLRRDIKILVDCDGVATLPNWDLSRGAEFECDVATRLNIPVLTVDEWVAIAQATAEVPAKPATLAELAEMAREDSLRWFPKLHENRDDFLIHSALGLAGEAGEAVDVIKKWHRSGVLNTESLGAELADVFVYLLHICTAAGIDLEDEYRRKAAFNETRFGANPIFPVVAQEG